MWLRRLALVSLIAMVACSTDVQREATYPDAPRNLDDRPKESIFGDEGISIFNSKRKRNDGQGIAVNAYLWRATLDTISFMPIASADPFGGLIVTDWYSSPNTPDERFKLNVAILDRQLRADSVRVVVFRQQKISGGKATDWQSVAVDPKLNSELEELILTRARELRIQQGAGDN